MNDTIFTNLFDDIYMRLILILFCVSVCGMIIFLIFSIKRHNIEWNILPGGRLGYAVTGFDQEINHQLMERVERDYLEATDIPIRENIICDHFGMNVGGIIIMFIGRFGYLVKKRLSINEVTIDGDDLDTSLTLNRNDTSDALQNFHTPWQK